MIEMLAPQEKEVLKLIASGLSTKEISNKMSITMKTVENYRDKICLKTKIRGIANLTRLAIRSGLVKA